MYPDTKTLDCTNLFNKSLKSKNSLKMVMHMTEVDHYNDYYEKFHLKKKELTEWERIRINDTLNILPEENSLLEVGCGDGRILNRLVGKYKNTCGLDISYNALKYVKTKTIHGNLENLPFPDNSFDIVMCCEVLEHLPYSTYKKAVEEIERVAGKYILISVPNNENLENKMVKCPQCSCSFHVSRHLRTFNIAKLKSLFKNFRLHKTKVVFVDQFILGNLIINLKKRMNILNPEYPKGSLCPQCGYSSEEYKVTNHKKNFRSKITDILSFNKKGEWIIALYKCSTH